MQLPNASHSPARAIVASVCNERRNSDLRADDKDILAAFDQKIAEIRECIASADLGIEPRADTRDWLAQVLQVATLDHGTIPELEKRIAGLEAAASRIKRHGLALTGDVFEQRDMLRRECDDLYKERDALLKDKGRLDWLTSREYLCYGQMRIHADVTKVQIETCGWAEQGDTLRDAIDAAMKAWEGIHET